MAVLWAMADHRRYSKRTKLNVLCSMLQDNWTVVVGLVIENRPSVPEIIVVAAKEALTTHEAALIQLTDAFRRRGGYATYPPSKSKNKLAPWRCVKRSSGTTAIQVQVAGKHLVCCRSQYPILLPIADRCGAKYTKSQTESHTTTKLSSPRLSEARSAECLGCRFLFLLHRLLRHRGIPAVGCNAAVHRLVRPLL